jgi:hypothetical protein
MKINLCYMPEQDRLRLSIQGHADWLVTRNLLLKLVSAWLEKLKVVDLPNVGFSLGDRDIRQEHALSLEFDGPTSNQQKIFQDIKSILVHEITLTVDPIGVKLVMSGEGAKTNLILTRKEAHLVLEMLAKLAREAKWLNEVVWPSWLGAAA